jgi:hypothetical protein
MVSRAGSADGGVAYPWPFSAVMMAGLVLFFSFQVLGAIGGTWLSAGSFSGVF